MNSVSGSSSSGASEGIFENGESDHAWQEQPDTFNTAMDEVLKAEVVVELKRPPRGEMPWKRLTWARLSLFAVLGVVWWELWAHALDLWFDGPRLKAIMFTIYVVLSVAVACVVRARGQRSCRHKSTKTE